MLRVKPDYYDDFRCIADKCKHNCCIGWEIEIDEGTDAYYKGIAKSDTPLGKKLADSIDRSGDVPCFITDENNRCPFLNRQNLCDIITELSEEHICTICTEHPRFHNELPCRTESGLGMCCEEAARIILTKTEPAHLIYNGDKECEDEITDLRDEIISVLQNRSKSIDERTEDMLKLCGIALTCKEISPYIDMFLSLERLDPLWTKELISLKEYYSDAPAPSFTDAQTEVMYEQLCVYLVYRHLANAPDLYEAGLRAAFAVLSYTLIRSLYTMHGAKGDSCKETFIELCRMYSAEIEYSDENLYIILDELDAAAL